jgi:hypothetical protein
MVDPLETLVVMFLDVPVLAAHPTVTSFSPFATWNRPSPKTWGVR